MIVRGKVRPPGDKSITHRALFLASLSEGRSCLGGALTAGDAKSTARILRQLGVDVGPLRPDARLSVRGGRWSQPRGALNCGNSGTAARLVLGLLAGRALTVGVTGDASLRRRPMRRVTEPLTRMGARFTGNDPDRLPLVISGGHLRDLTWIPPVASAQVKTALLFAAMIGRVRVSVEEPARSRDHTERMLRYLGLPIEVDGLRLALDGARVPANLPSLDLTIPADPSSAAFLVVAALLADGGELRIEGVCVNPTRIGYLNVLRRMGGQVELIDEREEGGEPVADLLVRPSVLTGTEVIAEEIPSLIDEVPVLAVAAARASGETAFRSVGELRVKESDRLSLVASNLRAVGIEAEVQGDDLVVRGAERPPAGRIETAHDHRLTMAFAVLGTVREADVRLSERASAAVSYPGFFDHLARIGADG
ncbi:MAG TPA: 3-phosphoshikimate 1-carboxyvinyltransferase [Gemmatimonadales bacterium]|nr:3-phosphoshikimate 1-carboxyvinyltransferase [Gemmatimonadales bacterium]